MTLAKQHSLHRALRILELTDAVCECKVSFTTKSSPTANARMSAHVNDLARPTPDIHIRRMPISE